MDPSFCLALPLVFLIVTWLGPEPALDDPLPKAETILDRLESASDASGARHTYQSLAMKGTFSVPFMPKPGRFEELYLGADRVKYTTDCGPLGTMTMGSDGKMSWSTDPGFGVMIKEGDAQASVRRLFAIGRRASWRTLYQRGETVARRDLDGRPHWELRLTPSAGEAETWFVDCETSRLSRVDLALPDPSGGSLSCQFLYLDWKPVGDILFPHVKKQRVGGMEITYTYESISWNEKLTPEQLAPPPNVVEALHDPQNRAKEAPSRAGECTLQTVAATPVLSIRKIVKATEISKSLADMLPAVGAYVRKAGAVTASPPFSRYHKIDGDTIDLEAGIAVKTAVPGDGRVQSSELPGGRVAVAWHIGPYQKLAETHELLKQWMAGQKLESSGGFWEVYWTDPGLEPDPGKWKTQILWPVK